MQLIGMLDSPYVRRVAVSLQLMGLPFAHRSLSVFRDMDAFRAINPAIKAPSLVCDDGRVLMDSTLILAYAEALPQARRSLMPTALPDLKQALARIGLALAGCEKAVQIVYERNVRPAEKLHAPWVARITAQMLAAYGALEADLAAAPIAFDAGRVDQVVVTAATAWRFTQATVPGLVDPAAHPHLDALGTWAETLPAFVAAPHGDSTCQAAG